MIERDALHQAAAYPLSTRCRSGSIDTPRPPPPSCLPSPSLPSPAWPPPHLCHCGLTRPATSFSTKAGKGPMGRIGLGGCAPVDVLAFCGHCPCLGRAPVSVYVGQLGVASLGPSRAQSRPLESSVDGGLLAIGRDGLSRQATAAGHCAQCCFPSFPLVFASPHRRLGLSVSPAWNLSLDLVHGGSAARFRSGLGGSWKRSAWPASAPRCSGEPSASSKALRCACYAQAGDAFPLDGSSGARGLAPSAAHFLSSE